MQSNMKIKVEFLAGTDIKDAMLEAKEKASQFNVAYIYFRFNSARNIYISSVCDIEKTLTKFHAPPYDQPVAG